MENSGPILAITQGIASGDVTDHTAIIWSRVSQPSMMHVEYSNNSLFSNFNSKTKWVDNTTDLTGKIKLDNLVGGTKYFYRVWFSNIDNRTKSLSYGWNL